MSEQSARVREAGQSPDRDQPELSRSLSVDLDQLLAWINRAIEAKGWTDDALASHMGGLDRSYINRVRNAEKPLSVKFLRALPDDVEALVATYWAESFGLIVVAPATSVKTAMENLTSGLFGLLVQHVNPESRIPKMAKATLESSPAATRRRA